MSDEALQLAALLATTIGMACLAISITAHWRQLFGQRQQSSSTRIVLRVAGAVLVVAALVVCAAADPFMMAILVWPMLLMVAAGLVALGFTVLARTRRFGPAATNSRERDAERV